MNALARALDEEFKRVALKEDLPMQDLVEDVARMCGCSTRQLYNYRAGKWPMPAAMLPALCERFNSTVLLKALSSEVVIDTDQLPNQIEAAEMISDLITEALSHHKKLVKALSPQAEIDLRELRTLEEQTERIIHRFRLLHSYAEARYEQQSALRRKQA